MMNFPSFLIAAVIAVLIILALVYVIRQKKAGKCIGCEGCGCAHCHSGHCRSKTERPHSR